jgi:flagellar motor switch protein FliG
VDVSALALALKRGASERLKATLLGALSQRAADTVQEEIDFMGSVSLKDIEQAQLLLIDAARRLEAEGVIDLSEAHAKTYALA